VAGRSMQGWARLPAPRRIPNAQPHYPSRRQPIEGTRCVYSAADAAFAPSVPGKLHFVGHYDGRTLIRAHLHRFRHKIRTDRHCGTPQPGSEFADFLKDWWAYKKLFGPAGQQLVTGLTTGDTLFGPIDYELGVIPVTALSSVSSLIIGDP